MIVSFTVTMSVRLRKKSFRWEVMKIEQGKEKIFILVGIVVFLLLCGFAFYELGAKTLTYYTKIDNTKITHLDTTDSMKYEYRLTMYDANGKSKEISFKTSRELKEGAYLEVQYLYISGVHAWQEINESELPEKVRSHYLR